MRACNCNCGCRTKFHCGPNVRRCLGCRAKKTPACRVLHEDNVTDPRTLGQLKARGGMNAEWIEAELNRLQQARRSTKRWTA